MLSFGCVTLQCVLFLKQSEQVFNHCLLLFALHNSLYCSGYFTIDQSVEVHFGLPISDESPEACLN